MCGIAGIAGNTGDNIAVIAAMLQAQHYRGPDAMLWKDWPGKCTLGHNRLSIIDLHETANQPMTEVNGRYTIVFNGEVYNYLELRQELSGYLYKTKSDTEVILAAYQQWGTQCLDRLNGMFAFAIWDEKENRLFAARDRFGIKPFNYAIMGGNLLFASELNTLFAAGVPKTMNEEVWAGYFVNGWYGQPDQTFWQSVCQLPAGHYLIWENEKLTISQWYRFEDRIHTLAQTYDEHWETAYRDLLQDAVRLRFRADVPVGFNISGGLDSSTLLALVNQLYPAGAIEAFTFTTGHPDYDELPWVKQMIGLTNNPLTECRLNAHEIPVLAETICKHQAEPMGGFPTIAYSNIFKKAREKGIIVLLDGQGMDEAWAGYDYYLSGSGSVVQGTKSLPFRPGSIDAGLAAKAIPGSWPKPFESDLQNLQYRDIFYTKIPRALRFNDRVSMMHSTELREPFLDYRLVELAFSRPESDKIRNGQQKWMLRQIASEMLGDKLALAPKRPLQTPQREWIKDDLRDWIESCLNEFCKLAWVNKKVVWQEWNNYRAHNIDNSFYIWQFVNTALIFK